MILIADSGSTKTDWRLIDEEKKIQQFQTQGISPYFQTTEEIAKTIKLELKLNASPKEIYFYGTGCKAEDKKQIVKNALQNCFKSSNIFIESDMLAAARALCGNNQGIATIMGTGSNTCFYDGKIIIKTTTSTGFILGDEGSGAHIGKTFIQAFLNDELPENILKTFNSRFNISKDEIIHKVYKEPMPNRYIASYSKFVYQNIKEQFMIDLLVNCFNQFFDKHVCKYDNYKEISLSCTGSVAFYYSNIIRAIAAERGIKIGTIVESPIAALCLYHLGE